MIGVPEQSSESNERKADMNRQKSFEFLWSVWVWLNAQQLKLRGSVGILIPTTGSVDVDADSDGSQSVADSASTQQQNRRSETSKPPDAFRTAFCYEAVSVRSPPIQSPVDAWSSVRSQNLPYRNVTFSSKRPPEISVHCCASPLIFLLPPLQLALLCVTILYCFSVHIALHI